MGLRNKKGENSTIQFILYILLGIFVLVVVLLIYALLSGKAITWLEVIKDLIR